jgi:ribosomal protein S18 acetylase RimI-like enzyme
MSTVIVRPAVDTDIEQIMRVHSFPQIKLPRRVSVQNAVDRAECYVALDHGILLGYGIINHSFFDHGFVSLVYVDPAQRRRGVGSSLFDEFEGRCRSFRIFTSTNLSNLPMHGFLASRHYTLSGVIQDIDEGDPEMFYSKRLR